MKELLILILLLSFVVNTDPEDSDGKVKCKDGELKNRICKCPQGKMLVNGECIDDLKNCINGSYRLGKCICQPGFTLEGGKECVKANCEAGTFKNGKCQCPPGKTLIDNKCKRRLDMNCKGRTIRHRMCISPSGKQLVKKQGVSHQTYKCRPGQKFMNGRCAERIPKRFANRIISKIASNSTTRMTHRFI